MRAGELEFLFTADTAPVAKAERDVKTIGQRIEKNPTIVTLKGAERDALAAMDRVEDAAKRLVSQEVITRVEADISKAEAETQKIRGELEYLNSVKGELQVDADIERAEGKLRRVDRTLQGLNAARATMEVDADTSPAQAELDGLADEAGEAGAAAGAEAGGGLMSGIVGALDSTPIVGAIVGIGALAGVALAKAISDGLAVEQRQDRLQALGDLSEGEAAKLGRAAGEAYAGNFGESIESNMDTARIAVQGGLLDPALTVRQSQQVIQSLAGIADVLDEDVRPVSVAVTQLLKTGLVKTADEAFDLIAAGAREGVNAQEDLLDTLTEYPSLFQRLGLTGEEALGLISQGLDAGARNSDLAADALKEFQIRATDGSKASAEGFQTLGLNAEEMTAKIAAGGDGAREGLDAVLDKLREIEDPVARNAAAVALFGTQAEDLGQALFAMDLSMAVEQLDGVAGSAQQMFDILGDNDAAKMESAKRNIEVAADGIKGALAAAFSDPLEDASSFVSENRAAVVGFLLDLSNGALDMGRSIVEGMAAGSEAVGDFGVALMPLVVLAGNVAIAMDKAFNGGRNSEELMETFEDAQVAMLKFHEQTDGAAEAMRTNLIENGIDPAQQRLNEFGIPQIVQAEFHDASLRAATALDAVGYAADGSQVSLAGVDLAALSASESGALLEGQLRNAVTALDEEAAAGARAGETQETLAVKYEAGRQALALQLQQMGLTKEEANALTAAYGAVPGKVDTAISSNAGAQTIEVGGLAYQVRNLPDGSFEVIAATDAAATRIERFISTYSNRTIKLGVSAATIVGNPSHGFVQADGAVVDYFANGSENHVAQIAPAGSWRVWAEPETGGEAYIPLANSKRARSTAILEDVAARFGYGLQPMADGGVRAAPMAPVATHPGGPTRLARADLDYLADRLAEGVLAGAGAVAAGTVTRAGRERY